MINDESRDPDAHELSDEHSHLRQLVQGIKSDFVHGPKSQAELLARLEKLNKVVLEHFWHEEAGGYFEGVVEVAPRMKDQADALLRQHPDLAEQLERLLDAARQKTPSVDSWQTMMDEYDAFMRAFERHEQAENSLLQEAYTRDIGTDD